MREFITNIRNAFQHYSIPHDQQGPFLLDYLRGGPKAEVKAMLSEGKQVKEVLDVLLESYVRQTCDRRTPMVVFGETSEAWRKVSETMLWTLEYVF